MPLALGSVASPSVFPDANNPPASQALRAVGGWGVAPDGGSVVVRLECAPFAFNGVGGGVTDATLRLTQTTTTGAVSATVLDSEDQTDHENNQTEARVTAAVSGVGVAFFFVEVSIDDTLIPAGEYSTTVGATVTAL